MTPLVTRHLQLLRDGGTVFGFPRSTGNRACYDQLARLCRSAEVRPPLTLQALSRLSISIWSAANAEAGRIIHGCGLGVMVHYLDQLALLRAVGPSVRLPEAFLTQEELEESERQRAELLVRFDAARGQDRRLILDVARLTAGDSSRRPL